jgi:hypothetical protein
MPPLLPYLLSFLLACQEEPARPADPAVEVVDEALTAFSNSLAEIQQAAIADVEARIAALPRSPVLAMQDKAAKALVPGTRSAIPPFHDPKEFTPGEAARGRVVRVLAAPDSLEAASVRERFRPWLNQPPYSARLAWDHGANQALAWAPQLDARGRLYNVLNGYPPEADVLVAWLLSQFDFEKKHDAAARYFGHCYADLNGKVYGDVTLYDAWSSGSGMDMPDVDTIAFARKLMKDSSYVAPLPADARRQKLYDAVSKAFLEYFKYRSWIDGAAQLLVNPDADVLREFHEPMRRRLLYLFATEKGDVARIAKRLKESGTRDKFIEALDAAIAADEKADRTIAKFVDARAEERWAIARAAHAALRAHHLLAD